MSNHTSNGGKVVDVTKVIELYQQGLSINKIGKLMGHTHGVIAYHLHKAHTMRKSKSKQRVTIPTEQILELYNQGLSIYAIGDKYGLNPQTVYSRLLKSGCKMRTQTETLKMGIASGRVKMGSRENNRNWKGGKTTTPQGYIELNNQDGRRQREHRYVWEQAYGKLPNGWVIHHLNGIKNDNRLENLFALPRKTHSPRLTVVPYQQRITQLEALVKQLRKEMQPTLA